MPEKQIGVAVRFISNWQPLPFGATLFDQAFMFALCDERDMGFDDKLIDALTFFRNRVIH